MAGSRGFAVPVALAFAAAASALAFSVLAPDRSGKDLVTLRGTVRLEGGTVTFSGTPPAPTTIDMSADGYCTEQNTSPVMDSPVQVGSSGGLGGVLVYVSNAASGSGPAATEVLLDQVKCIYAPGSVGVRTGATIVIRNSDQTLHNVRVSPTVNRGFNLGQPMRGIESKRSFDSPEIGIPVRCDIHGWMNATIHVLDHGFFAVTDADGNFELPQLPAGDWTVEAWHGTLGTSTQTVSASGGATASVNFEFSGS
jgi:hypothetical protein